MALRRTGPVLAGATLSSAAVLMLEVVLTRVFAVAQFHHFAFVAVSLALLGFGASGSFLFVWPRLGRGGPRRWATLAALQALATVAGYLVANLVPFDSFTIAWDPIQIWYLSVIYLALAAPFFFAGALIAALLSGWDQEVRIPTRYVYAANLAGAGLGAPLALLGIDRFGGDWAVVATALIAALAVPLILLGHSWRETLPALGVLSVLAVFLVVAGSLTMPLRLSLYKELSGALRYPGAVLVSSEWTASSRVDYVASEGIRSLPGLSLTYPGVPAAQHGITVDGDNLSVVPLVGPGEADYVPYLLTALPHRLRPEAETVVLDSGGGLGVLTALGAGASRVVAVEPDPLVAEAAEAAPVYQDDRVALVIEDPRGFVERTEDRFDLVHLALTSPFRPVTSGAYSLAEDYSLTVEAVSAYLDILQPDGVLALVRWLQTPPSEGMRAMALVTEALRDRGLDPEGRVIALRSFNNLIVLAAPDGFDRSDISEARGFAEESRFDLVALPGSTAEEANRFNLVPNDDYFNIASLLLGAESPTELYNDYPFELTPPRDDHPFFHHYFTFGQTEAVLAALGRTWQPFGGAGYFVLVALLLLSLLAAVILIVAPLILRARRGPGMGWTVSYFGLLGLAFLLVEIPIFQRYIVVLGRPTTALAVVVAAVLIASGLGSLTSARLSWSAGAVTLTVLALAQPLIVAGAAQLALGRPLWVRAVLVVLSVLPVSFLMGTMFPKGLAWLETHHPGLIPWAWGINGAASVVSSISAALLALAFGFTTVMLAGAVCYGGAALLALVRGRTG